MSIRITFIHPNQVPLFRVSSSYWLSILPHFQFDQLASSVHLFGSVNDSHLQTLPIKQTQWMNSDTNRQPVSYVVLFFLLRINFGSRSEPHGWISFCLRFSLNNFELLHFLKAKQAVQCKHQKQNLAMITIYTANNFNKLFVLQKRIFILYFIWSQPIFYKISQPLQNKKFSLHFRCINDNQIQKTMSD